MVLDSVQFHSQAVEMSLVQYSSSSEESDVEDEQASQPSSSIVENKTTSNSISSFLPPPKNRQPPKREPRVLGKAIKQIAGASAVNPDNIVLDKSSKQVTSFIPSSLRNKQKSTSAKSTPIVTEKEESKPEIEIFQQAAKTKPKSITSKQTKVEIRPITSIDDSEVIIPEDDSKKRKLQDDDPDSEHIQEFNVSDFYQKNMELKDQGLLEENKRLHTVTHSKNQLSALLKNAKQDEEVLSERIERSKRLKKEKGNQYGW